MKLHVKAHPKASRARVIQKDAENFEVWVIEAPEKGRANAAVIEALSEHLGVSKSRLSVVSGRASRNKVIRLA